MPLPSHAPPGVGDDDDGPEHSRVTIDAATAGPGSGRASNATTTTSTSTGERRGLLGRVKAVLSSHQQQSVATRTASPAFGALRGRLNTVEPADGVNEYYAIYESTAIVFTALWNFASDVWEPGYRVETDDEDIKEFLEDHWLPRAAVLYGGKHNDFHRFGKHTTIQRWARGGALIEHVRADPAESTSPITGVNFIPPETVSFVPYEHKPILVDPDPSEGDQERLPSGLDQTPRGEFPAYVQYHRNAPTPTARRPIPLSQNDVSRTIFNGDPAGVGEDLDKFWGTPITAIIAEDVAGFKNILRDKEEAIKTKAYGLWELAFDREVLEYTDIDESGEQVDVTEIIEWGDDDKSDVEQEIEEDLGPGGVLTHDGAIEMNRLDGEVPELIDDLEFYVSNITSALPTPLYVVGFETDINQFVVDGQESKYNQLIDSEREANERTYTQVMKHVVRTNLVENSTEVDGTTYSVSEVPSDLKFKIEPPEEESPVLSLTDEQVDRMKTWAEAYDLLRGDVPADMFADPESLRELILQLPEDAAPEGVEGEGGGLGEMPPELRQAAEDMGIAPGDDIDAEDGGEGDDAEGDQAGDGEGGVPPELDAEADD